MEKIRSMTENIKKFFKNMIRSIKNGKAQIDFYKSLWERPEGKKAAANLWKQFLYLIKKIKPSKIRGNMIFGTGDPAVTGQLLGAVAVLYGRIPENLQIIPDFEEARFEGTVHVKGKIRIIHVAVAALRLLIDRNFRYVVKQLMTKEGTENEQQ